MSFALQGVSEGVGGLYEWFLVIFSQVSCDGMGLQVGGLVRSGVLKVLAGLAIEVSSLSSSKNPSARRASSEASQQ